MSQYIKTYLQEASDILNTFSADEKQIQAIESATAILVQSLKKGGKAISCGNGGSMSDAMHFAEELTGRYRDDRPSMAAISISDPSYLTCVGNDYGYESIFSRDRKSVV